MDLILTYLAMLTDEERDRVIVAQEWCSGAMNGHGGPRCLLGHARGSYDMVGLNSLAVALYFDVMCERFGIPATVARVKAECARLNDCVPTAAPARETVGAL